MIGRYRSSELLIVDEIGVQFGTEAERAQLFDVIDGRYREERPSLIVSNLSPKGLQECLGGRPYDRLIQNGSACVVFNWESYRPSAPLATLKRSPREQGASAEANQQPSVVAMMRELAKGCASGGVHK